jgi:hypothetical protein
MASERKCELEQRPVEIKLYKYLINNGISQSDIKDAINNSEVMGSLQEQLIAIQTQQEIFNRSLSNEDHLVELQKTDRMFSTFGDLGTKLNSKALIKISKTGCLAMEMAVGFKRYCTMSQEIFSMTTLFEPITMIASIAIGFMGLFDEPSFNPMEGFIQLVNSLAQHIDQHVEGLHEHLSAIHSDIIQVAGMINQCLRNQEQIYNLQKATYELVSKSFSILNTRLSDLQSGTRESLEQIHSDIQYLIEIGELREIKNFKEKIKSNINSIKTLNSLQIVNPQSARICLLEEKMSNLETHLTIICSKEWNGSNEYSKNNLRQCSEYITRRIKSGDLCLAYLAEKFELLMDTKLESQRINKNILFPNVLWIELVKSFVEVSQLPSVRHYNSQNVFQLIDSQARNVIKFIDYVKSCEFTLFDKLINKHKQLLDDLQLIICQSYTHRKSDSMINKSITLNDFFNDTINKYLYNLDENYLLTKLFCYLIGKRGIELSNSSQILQQKFNFSEQSSITLTINDLSYGYYNIDSWHHRNSWCADYAADFIGAHVVNNEIIYTNISTCTQPQNRILISSTIFNTLKDKYKTDMLDGAQSGIVWPIQSGYRNTRQCDFRGGNMPYMWATSHIHSAGNNEYLVIFSPGTSEVAIRKVYEPPDIFDIMSESKEIKVEWLKCTNNGAPATLQTSFGNKHQIKDKPFQTCMTNILGTNLCVNIFDWHGDPEVVTLRCEMYDLVKLQWCDKKEEKYLFPGIVRIDKKNVQSPNQLIIQNVKWTTYDPFVRGEYIIGMLIPGFQLKVEILQRQYGWVIHSGQTINIETKEICQVKSELLDEKLLVVAASIRTTDDENKLIFLTTTVNDWKQFKLTEHELPKTTDQKDVPGMSDVADYQAMRTAIVKIGTKRYVITTLLDNNFNALIFCFDPITKQIIQLVNGPKIFDYDTITNISHIRKQLPGYYPVRSYEMRAVEVNDMIMLYFSVTKMEHGKQRTLTIIPYKLCPIIKTVAQSSWWLSNRLNNNAIVLSILNAQLLANRQAIEYAQQPLLLTNGTNDIDNIKRKLNLNTRLMKTYLDKIPHEQKDMFEEVKTTFNVIDTTMNTLNGTSDSKRCAKLFKKLKRLIDTNDVIFKTFVKDYVIADNINRMLNDMDDVIKKFDL